jgi:hypothetical protein
MGKRYRGRQRNFLGVHPYEAGMILGIYWEGYKGIVTRCTKVVGQYACNWWASRVLRRGRGRHRTGVLPGALTKRITVNDLMRRLDEEAVQRGVGQVLYPPSPLEQSIRLALSGMNTAELAEVGIRKEVVPC